MAKPAKANGRPRKELVPSHLDQIERLAAVLPLEQIGLVIGMSDTTLWRRMKEDPKVLQAYKRGKSKVNSTIATSLIQKALAGDVTAMIFYLKTQCGWKETTVQEQLGPDGGAIQHQHEIIVTRRLTTGEE